MDPKKTGYIISEARKKLNMTQKELADKLYITDKAVSKWERGLCFPDISVLIPLTEILNINLYDLLRGEFMKKEELEKTLKDTIEYSNKEIKKNKKKAFITSSISLIILLIISVIIITNNKEKKLKEEIIMQDKILKISEYTAFKTNINNKNGSNIESILYRMPLNYPSRIFDLDDDSITAMYSVSYKKLVKDYKDEIKVKNSMINAGLILFTAVEDLDEVIFRFEDRYFVTNKKTILKEFKIDNLNDLSNLENWNTMISNYLSTDEKIENIFRKIYKVNIN